VFKISAFNINTWLAATKKGLPCSFKHSRLRIVSAASIIRSRNSVSMGLVYPFSASSSNTVGFRTLLLLTFSAYFGVTNHFTNFWPIVCKHPVCINCQLKNLKLYHNCIYIYIYIYIQGVSVTLLLAIPPLPLMIRGNSKGIIWYEGTHIIGLIFFSRS